MSRQILWAVDQTSPTAGSYLCKPFGIGCYSLADPGGMEGRVDPGARGRDSNSDLAISSTAFYHTAIFLKYKFVVEI